MSINIFAFAVPFFLFFIGLEYFIGRKYRKNIHHFRESIANLNVGVAERLIDLFTASSFYFFYDYLHRHFALFQMEPSLLLWIALILGTDLLWYWYHRLGHEVNLFWAAHIVHHQSEDFNYTTGTRITILQAVVRTAFWSVLPVIGFPAEMISTVLVIHGLYPFFTHTQLIGNLGILEYLLVTPSHHRVHHASNDIYLDKNYGDMFIIWDKLFGTFAKETVPPQYGLTKSLDSYSFLWQHFHYFVELGIAIKQQKGIINKLKIIFGKPEDFDSNIRPTAEKLFRSESTKQSTPTKLKTYVLIQMAITMGVLFGLLLLEKHIPFGFQVAVAIIILLTLINIGAILEQQKWVFYLEYLRLVGVSLTLWCVSPTPISIIVMAYVVVLSFIYFQSLKSYYLQLIYG